MSKYALLILLMMGWVMDVSAQPRWVEVNNAGTTKPFRIFAFGDTVMIVDIEGDGRLVTSHDGGESWSASPFPTDFSTGQFFLNSRLGWALHKASPSDQMYRTTDGGDTWILSHEFSNLVTAAVLEPGEMQFLNQDTGYFIGAFATTAVYKTTDGGSTFSISEGGIEDRRAISFVNADFGWAAGYEPDACRGDDYYCIKRTTDGGGTWENLLTPFSSRIYFRCVTALNENICWAGGSQNHLIRTVNGAVEDPFWERVPCPIGYAQEIQVLNENSIWVRGKDSVVLHTTGGMTSEPEWTRYTLPLPVYDFVMLSDVEGWAVGWGNRVYHFTDEISDVPDNLSESSMLSFQVKSDPAQDRIGVFVELPSAADLTISLFNAEGKHITRLFQGRKEAGVSTIDVGLPSVSQGVYFVRLSTGSESHVRSLILSR